MNSRLAIVLVIAHFAVAATATGATLQTSVDARPESALPLLSTPAEGRDPVAVISEKLNSVVMTLEAAPYAGLEARLDLIETRLLAIEEQLAGGDTRVTAAAARLLQTSNYATTADLMSAVLTLQAQIVANRTLAQSVARGMVSSLAQATNSNLTFITASLSAYQNQTAAKLDATNRRVDGVAANYTNSMLIINGKTGLFNDTMVKLGADIKQMQTQMGDFLNATQAKEKQLMDSMAQMEMGMADFANQTMGAIHQIQAQIEAYQNQSMMAPNMTDMMQQAIHAAIQDALKQMGLGNFSLPAMIQQELANLGLPANMSLEAIVAQAQAMIMQMLESAFGPAMPSLQNMTSPGLAQEVQYLLSMVVPQLLNNMTQGLPMGDLSRQIQQMTAAALKDFMAQAHDALVQAISHMPIYNQLANDTIIQPILAMLHKTLADAINQAITNALGQTLGPMAGALAAPLSSALDSQIQMALNDTLNKLMANITMLVQTEVPALLANATSAALTQFEDQIMAMLNSTSMIPMMIQQVQAAVLSQLQQLLPNLLCMTQMGPANCSMGMNMTQPGMVTPQPSLTDMISQTIHAQLANMSMGLASMLNGTPLANLPSALGQLINAPDQMAMLQNELMGMMATIQNSTASHMFYIDQKVSALNATLAGLLMNAQMESQKFMAATQELGQELAMLASGNSANMTELYGMLMSQGQVIDGIVATMSKQLLETGANITQIIDPVNLAITHIMALIDGINQKLAALNVTKPARLLADKSAMDAKAPTSETEALALVQRKLEEVKENLSTHFQQAAAAAKRLSAGVSEIASHD